LTSRGRGIHLKVFQKKSQKKLRGSHSGVTKKVTWFPLWGQIDPKRHFVGSYSVTDASGAKRFSVARYICVKLENTGVSQYLQKIILEDATKTKNRGVTVTPEW
jgi:hypothetical protein